jgi:hypothetical protein
MKLKILRLPLVGILAGLGTAAAAQETAAANCTVSECSNADGTLLRVRVPAPVEPVAGAGQTSGQAQAVQLPQGGSIWASEDPTLGQPELAISAPALVAFDDGRIVTPVRFFLRSNYSAFIKRYELTVYRGHDADLVQPIAQVPLPVAAVSQAEWDGALPQGMPFRTGDELIYVLRAYDETGNFDETGPQKLQLVSPEEAERGTASLRTAVERSLGAPLSAEQATSQALIDDAFAGNNLRIQNIAIYGSRVRIQGRNLPEGYGLSINGENYPVDRERKFVAEYLMPVGRHRFDVSLAGAEGTEPIRHALAIDVSGSYMFGVGIADITLYQSGADGPGQDLPLAGREDDLFSEGRLAFYLKAKARGKYLITAHADTKDRPLGDLFDGFTKADPQDIFRRLDPDLYYPTYGDDSNTYRDIDTMGRFYVRLDWDKNQALWGNYHTGITGTEFAQYVRSLYGAAVDLRSRDANAWGGPVTELRAFGSQAETAPGHSEFIGTGGSLYYLRHTDVLPGSDRVVLEVRDQTTGRVEQRIDMVRGADYEIDELQGRIVLTRPLLQVTRENISTITRDTPLDGFEQRLLVDYEWVPSSFSSDEISAGLRGKHWFGDHVGVGVTYVDENRAGDDYTLMGADLTLQAGKGTYLKLEHSRTEATSAPVFFSDNGGLSFTQLNPLGPREGDATSVETRANFQELGLTSLEWNAAAWWRRVEAGYSISRYDTGQDVEEYGAELLGQATRDIRLNLRYSRAERGDDSFIQAQGNAEWRFGEASQLAAEVRRIEESRAGIEAAGLLGALRYTHRIGTAVDLYGTGQLTLDDDSGRYADNDALTLGGRYNFGELSNIGVEATTGDRGDAVELNGEYRLNPQHSIYGNYTVATDQGEYDSLFNPASRNGWTLGQRVRLSNQVHMFNESQYLKERHSSGLARTFGLDFYPAQGWTFGVTLSDGRLTDTAGGIIDRRAISVRGGRTSVDVDWQSKVEFREDRGAARVTQWVTTNRLTYKIDESWRIAGRFNYADTDDQVNPLEGAKFVEANLGFAYRPWNSTRWGLFGRYTFLYDLASSGQIGGAEYDQKTQIFSLEGVYRLDHHWELAGKVARREGEMRFGRGSGDWFDSATSFAAGQVRYELRDKWHAMAEYRWLNVKDGGTRQGWLVGIDRDVTQNLRIGAGYNFTSFSDDLTEFGYDHKGWFINFVGSY